MPTNCSVNRATVGLGRAVDNSPIGAACRFVVKLVLQMEMGTIGFGNRDRPGCVFIQPMHNHRALYPTNSRKGAFPCWCSTMPQQCVYERALRMSWRWMDHHAR